MSALRRGWRVWAWLTLIMGGAAHAAPEFVMLVSVDGLKPEAVLDAAHADLDLPNLRALQRDGAYATGVRGVMPTLTYPSHMTLMTGASPAAHGIYSNTTFDPYARNLRGWYWYAEDARVDTLWSAAARAHRRTANVYWPTSVGAPITYNLPQIWRSGTDDDLKLQRALGTPGLEAALGAGLERYPGGEQETVADDEIRAAYAIRLLATKHPQFITVYLTGLDTEQHKTGPFSAAANAALERIDKQVGKLRAAAEAAAPGHAVFCLVSDHGFAAVEHDLNLYAAFLEAGLFSVDQDHKITSWQAMPWPAGGTAAVVLADPDDAGIRSKVDALLKTLASDPANGIENVLSGMELARSKGFPTAAFIVSLRAGYEIGLKFSMPLVSAPSNLGMHGYSPQHMDMRSVFFMVAPRVRPGRSLGEIDMRQIAPTLAARMGVSLKDAELGGLELQ